MKVKVAVCPGVMDAEVGVVVIVKLGAAIMMVTGLDVLAALF